MGYSKRYACLEAPMSFRAPLLAVSFFAVLSVARSGAAEEALHEVIAPPAQGKVGATGRTMVTLTGKNGWHLNEQAPVTLKLTPSAGISVEKPKMGRKDLVEDTKERARFDIAFTPAEAGRKTIDAEANFVVCQEAACKPVKEKVTLAVVVSPAGKDPAKPAGKK